MEPTLRWACSPASCPDIQADLQTCSKGKNLTSEQQELEFLSQLGTSISAQPVPTTPGNQGWQDRDSCTARKAVIVTDPGTTETAHQQFRAAWGCTYRSVSETVLASFSWTCPSFPPRNLPRQHTRAARHQAGLLATWDTYSQCVHGHSIHMVAVTFGKQVSYPLQSISLQHHY